MLLTTLTAELGPNVWRLGMPEFDQGGGCWANGRPSLTGLSATQAYDTWTGFYLDTKGLRPYLARSAGLRGYKWMSVCSYAFCSQYAFDLGADAVLLERNEDEMSGITPGLAMVRGAARQHGDKEWGIDFSTWRYWNNGPTVYANGKLVTGWSTSTFKRNLFIAYMGGANLVHNEAADYTTGAAVGSTLNPLGQTVQQFYDFAVTRHPDRGTPFVPLALMHDHDSGFEPKFGEWMQGASTWYWNLPYSKGDTMFANLLALAYPGYNTWGTIVASAPWLVGPRANIDVAATNVAYQQALANGADPRPWEPMGNSRWGESFDLITDQVTLSGLRHYKAVVLATSAPVGDPLLAALTQYATDGGTVVVNAKQLGVSAESFTGLHLNTSSATATSVTWVPDGSTLSEASFVYTVATATTASVVAQAGGNPIVTKNSVGAGAVYVTTPDYLVNTGATQILNVGQKLLDMLIGQVAPVVVSGPALEYLISTDGGRIVVTLVNTDLGGAAWSGTLTFAQPVSAYSVKEWTSDASVASSAANGRVVVNATVPAFDVRVYVLDTP